MLSTLLALTMSVADPLGFPPVVATLGAAPRPAEQGSSGPHPAAVEPGSPSRSALGEPSTGEGLRPSPPAAGPLPGATSAGAPALTLPASSYGLGNLVLPGVALALLAAVTLLLKRRTRQEPRLVRVLETTSLGPKRALVVARLGDELLVIGSSEAGLHLLAARPAGDGSAAGAAGLRAVPDLATATATPAPRPNPLAAMLGRLRGARGAADAEAPAAPPADLPAFDALLAESAEDQELRRKLARGQSGSVR